MSMLLFWDVDGTLIDNDTSGQDLFRDALIDVVAPDVEIPEINRHGKTDLQIVEEYLAAVGAPRSKAPDMTDRLAELSRTAYRAAGTRAPLPGVVHALRSAMQEGNVNTFLTGNSTERSRLKVASSGIDLDLFDWASGCFGEQARRRADLATAAVESASQAALNPLVIGDTPADGAAAASARIPFCAVATGVYSAEDLAAVDHVLVIDNLVDGFDDFMELLRQLG